MANLSQRLHLLPEAGGIRSASGQLSEVYLLLERLSLPPVAVARKPDELLDPGLETLQLQPSLTFRAGPLPVLQEAPIQEAVEGGP